MQPLSTFNILSVVGRASPAGLSLNPATQTNAFRVLANQRITVQDDSTDSVSITYKARQLAQTLDLAGLPNEEAEEFAESIEESDLEEEVKEAKLTQATLQIGKEVSEDISLKAKEERIRDLKDRDRQVRQREEAHVRAAGSLASGGAKYRYEIGPDGKQYAVEGHTDIKVRQGNTPEERLRNAHRAEQAASAGGAVTPKSSQTLAEARREAAEAKREIEKEQKETNEDLPSPMNPAPLENSALFQKAASAYEEQENILKSSQVHKID